MNIVSFATHHQSHHQGLVFFFPPAAQSSSDVVDISGVDSTPLGNCGYIDTGHLWFVCTVRLWILSIYENKFMSKKVDTDKGVNVPDE